MVASISHISGPVSMAALTTSVAGFCLLPTRVLAYVQIGTFIVIVMTASWLISTFFFQALLSLFAPKRNCKPKVKVKIPKPEAVSASVSAENDKNKSGKKGGQKFNFGKYFRMSSNGRSDVLTLSIRQDKQPKEQQPPKQQQQPVTSTPTSISTQPPQTRSVYALSDSQPQLNGGNGSRDDVQTTTATVSLTSETALNTSLDSIQPCLSSQRDLYNAPHQRTISVGRSFAGTGDRSGGNGSRDDVQKITAPVSLTSETALNSSLDSIQPCLSSQRDLYNTPHQRTITVGHSFTGTGNRSGGNGSRDDAQKTTATASLTSEMAFKSSLDSIQPCLSSQRDSYNAPHQRIITVGRSFAGDRSGVATLDVHAPPPPLDPREVEFAKLMVVEKQPLKGEKKRVRYKREDGTATLPSNLSTTPPLYQPISTKRIKQSTASSSSSDRYQQRRSVPEFEEYPYIPPPVKPATTAPGYNDDQGRSLDDLCVSAAVIHCDSPTIRADLENQRRKRLMTKKQINAAQIAVTKKQRRRLQSLPADSYPLTLTSKARDIIVVSPAPPVENAPLVVMKSASAKALDEMEEARLVMEVVHHRRKNSYKKAQEREPIDWNSDIFRERRKSSGNLDEEEQMWRRKRMRQRLAAERNSSSLGDILSSFEKEDNNIVLAEEEKRKKSGSGKKSGAKKKSTGKSPVKRKKSINSNNNNNNNPSMTPAAASSKKLRSSYHYERHPFSHSTNSILTMTTEDPLPIVPNRCPGTPDVWVPRTVVQA